MDYLPGARRIAQEPDGSSGNIMISLCRNTNLQILIKSDTSDCMILSYVIKKMWEIMKKKSHN